MSSLKFLFASFLLAFPIFSTFAQSTAPVTDLYLVEIDQDGDAYNFTTPVNLTNREGYDNQPAFSPDGTFILYSSMRDDNQTDIYKYDLESMRSEPWCQTPYSEYSPTYMPGDLRVSVVRVEKDSTQRVWSFTNDGMEPYLEYQEIKGVGYHAWGNHNRILATFLVTDPPMIRMFENDEFEPIFESKNVGRSMHKIPNREAISFVDKEVNKAEGGWMIREVDLTNRDVKDIISTLEGQEDYCWGPDGTLWMPSGLTLYKYHPDKDSYWVPVRTFNEFENMSFYRVAMNRKGTHMVLVSSIPKSK